MAFKPRTSTGASKNNGDDKGGQGGRINTSTFVAANSYDSQFSALGFKHLNQAGLIEFSPIIPEMIGRQPKKGEKVYDHESKLSLMIQADGAQALIEAIDLIKEIMENEEAEGEPADKLKSIDIHLGNETIGERRLTLFIPGRTNIKRAGNPIDLSENFLMQIAITKDGEKLSGMHILQNRKIAVNFTKDSANEGGEQLLFTGLNLLRRFAEAVIDSAMNTDRHGAAQAVATLGGGSSKTSARETQKKFGDVDVDDEGEDSSSAPSTSSAKAAATSSLEEEFNDDDVPQ